MLITILLWLFVSTPKVGQPPPVVKFLKASVKKPIQITDTSKIIVRHFNGNAIKKLKNSPDFDYFRKIDRSVSLWERFWNWVWGVYSAFMEWIGDIFRKLFGSAKAGSQVIPVIKFIIISSAVIGLAYVVFKLFGIDLLKIFKKETNTIEIPYSETSENIHDISFDEAIEQAIQVKDYRLAVRLLYLRSLKQLSDADLIHWKLEKSNSEYINELKNENQREKFQVVTRHFEYVWYGSFPVDGETFGNINNFFQEFKETLA